METTFMTIHNLSQEANIMYASDSIVDILGYHPDEVMGRSCFEYFHPDEVPFARLVHNRGVQLDKAAVLHYARIKGRGGQWVGCECVFTVVYDVLVACTSIYLADEKSDRRAAEAPVIRRLFASSPSDPRYHMLEHLSSKFRAPPAQREPRAALILNRFTRTLTVLYATDAVSDILGVTPAQIKDKSFYECIQENCLPDAIRCLESAKANDSIAYMRFWYRDPRRAEDVDEEMREASLSSDSEDGGVELRGEMQVDISPFAEGSASPSGPESSSSHQIGPETAGDDNVIHLSTSPPSQPHGNSRMSSRESTDPEQSSANAIFDQAQNSRSSTSSMLVPPRRRRVMAAEPFVVAPPVEIEAVVSCTADGLVVILRRARRLVPAPQQPIAGPQFPYGLFAAPWGANPIRPHRYQPDINNPFQHNLQAPLIPAGGPPMDEFMNSIREVAVFAWSLAGINGNIASYGRGIPRGEAQPPGGLPIWDPYAQPNPGYPPPVNQAEERWIRMDERVNNANVVHFHGTGVSIQYQNGHGAGPMVSGRPGSSAHRYLGNLGGYAYQGPGNYQNNQYQMLFVHAQAPPPDKAPNSHPHGPSGPGQGPH